VNGKDHFEDIVVYEKKADLKQILKMEGGR
jgi:hypothetical protein